MLYRFSFPDIARISLQNTVSHYFDVRYSGGNTHGYIQRSVHSCTGDANIRRLDSSERKSVLERIFNETPTNNVFWGWWFPSDLQARFIFSQARFISMPVDEPATGTT